MANLIEILLKELNNEAAITRKFLAIIPADKFDWRPHPKSMTLIQLATHLVELPSWVSMVIHTTELDLSAGGYDPKVINSVKELEEYFEQNLSAAENDLKATNEDHLAEQWVLKNGEDLFFAESRADMIRIAYSQTIHHRAQLGVFLRLLDIPIPGSYGPSADEMQAAEATA